MQKHITNGNTMDRYKMASEQVPYFNFEIGFLYNIKNVEYLGFFNHVFLILEEQNFKTELLTPVIEIAREHKEILETYLLKDLKHASTGTIQELKDKRHGQIGSLRSLIDGSVNRETQELRDAAKTLQFIFNDLREDIRSRNSADEMWAISVLEGRVRDNKKYEDALETLNLTELFESLVEMNNELRILEGVRAFDRHDDKRHSKERRRNSYIAFRNVLHSLNIVMMVDEDEREKAYNAATGINELLTNVRREYRKRQTKNRNKNKGKQ